MTCDGPWTERQRLLLAAVDELHDEDAIGDETFAGLRPILSDEELIELCMLAGHYSMVAGVINSARIESDGTVPPVSGTVAGKAVLVTGAAGGIGRATALEACSRGAAVVITDIQEAPLAATARVDRARGGKVLASEALDLTDVDAIKAFAGRVHAEHGSMDVVMNVAGTSTWGSVDRLTNATGARWSRST